MKRPIVNNNTYFRSSLSLSVPLLSPNFSPLWRDEYFREEDCGFCHIIARFNTTRAYRVYYKVSVIEFMYIYCVYVYFFSQPDKIPLFVLYLNIKSLSSEKKIKLNSCRTITLKAACVIKIDTVQKLKTKNYFPRIITYITHTRNKRH